MMSRAGDVMSIGRNFEETIQKALRIVDGNSRGFDAERFVLEMVHRGEDVANLERVRAEPQKPAPTHSWAIAKAFGMGTSDDEVHAFVFAQARSTARGTQTGPLS